MSSSHVHAYDIRTGKPSDPGEMAPALIARVAASLYPSGWRSTWQRRQSRFSLMPPTTQGASGPVVGQTEPDARWPNFIAMPASFARKLVDLFHEATLLDLAPADLGVLERYRELNVVAVRIVNVDRHAAQTMRCQKARRHVLALKVLDPRVVVLKLNDVRVVLAAAAR